MAQVEDRRFAESEYKSAFHALWRSAEVAGVPDVMASLHRFQQAATKLSLTRPEQMTSNGPNVLKGWPMRGSMQAVAEAALTTCPVCGGKVPVKPPSQTGPQRVYCSHRCMIAAINRRMRDKRRGGPVKPVTVAPVPSSRLTRIIRHSNHVYIVMTAQQLIARRKRAGWPPDLYDRLVMELPRVVCERCLRSERQIRREERLRRRLALHQVAPPDCNDTDVHTHNRDGNGRNDLMVEVHMIASHKFA